MSKPVVVYMVEGYTGYCSGDGNVNWGVFATEEEAKKEVEYLAIACPGYDMDVVSYEVYEKSTQRVVKVQGRVSVSGRVLNMIKHPLDAKDEYKKDEVTFDLSLVVASDFNGIYAILDGENSIDFLNRVVGEIQQEFKQAIGRRLSGGKKV